MARKKYRVAIDPGRDGAVAIDTGNDVILSSIQVWNSELLNKFRKKIDIVIIELPSVPRRTLKGIYKLWLQTGYIIGRLHEVGLQDRTFFVPPRVWKKHYRISSQRYYDRKRSAYKVAKELIDDVRPNEADAVLMLFAIDKIPREQLIEPQRVFVL